MRMGIAIALVMLSIGPVAADPGYYVITPYEREGQLSAEFRYWAVRPKGGASTVWPELGLSYGVNSRWTTLLLESWVRDPGEAMYASSLSWQNEILFTQGDRPYDLALHLSLIRLQGDEPGDSYEFGPIYQTEFGPHQVNLNAIFERTRKAGSWGPTKLKYQWQYRMHGHRWFNPGMQGFGELGPWSDWSAHAKQSHRAGPAAFFTQPQGGPHALQFQVALLLGSTYTRNGQMLSARLLVPF